MTKTFDNLLQLIAQFPTDEACRTHFEAIRWNGKPVCPHCSSEKVYALKRANQFKCANKECYKHFNVLTGTIFENTKIALRTWFIAIYVATNHKKGISSCQLARDLGITQKTAWFVLSRVREMLKEKNPGMLSGMVEADEVYIGGKLKNKHAKDRKATANATSPSIKTAVLGVLQRGGNVQAYVVPDVKRTTVIPIIRKALQDGTVLYTDSSHMYTPLKTTYTHESVNHVQNEYVRGIVHTNSIEGFWSQLKRGIIGVYHQVSPKHLHRYCSEFEFRYNTREAGEGERFNAALKQSNIRLKYEVLIGG